MESDGDDDDFEVVPLAEEVDDVDMWDVEDENEDDIKQEKIRSTSGSYQLSKLYLC